MNIPDTLEIATDSSENEFQVRLLKEEGVGLLTTRSGKNYLMLDSLDYWFDLIQKQYPGKKKCTCKNEWFKVKFEYIKRENNDFKHIIVYTTCTSCGKISKSLSIDIDYSPSGHLFETPLTFCEYPDIRYKLTEINGYWSLKDFSNLLSFLFSIPGINVYCWFFRNPEKQRFFKQVSLHETLQEIIPKHRYLNFFFSLEQIDIESMIEFSDENGVYLLQDIWRKNELIQLASPVNMAGYGMLYYIHYCNQFLDKNVLTDKSSRFEELTDHLYHWCTEHFIQKRGKNCFDGKESYEKYIAGRKIKHKY